MNEQDLQQLERFVDGELPADEVAAIEARIAEDDGWAEAHADLLALRHILQDDVAAAVEAADFSDFFARIEAQLPDGAPAAAVEAAPSPARAAPAEPEEGLFGRIKRWFGQNWLPTAVIAGAAAAVAVWAVAPGAGQDPTNPANESGGAAVAGAVVVDQVDNNGPQTVLISQPAEDEGATVIWLLDEEEADDKPLDGEDPI